jgi:SET domain-containing protein
MYRPLPANLTIKNSGIEGLGLFATDDIPEDEHLGTTHIDSIPLGLLRTPLGGFINHSETPNCVLQIISESWQLYTIKNIKKNDELTLKYKTYNPCIKQ